MIPATVVDMKEVVFPVVSMNPKTGKATKPLVYGTAFCIGPGVFLTAGHVLRAVHEDGGTPALLDLRAKKGEPLSASAALEAELIDTHDVAVVKCNMSAFGLLDWETEAVWMLTDVHASGYPYAVSKYETPPAYKVLMRGFKGHIITRRQLWHLQPEQPVGYEVSCQFPPGLSGAPLLRDSGGPRVVGIVLGQDQIQTGIDDDPTSVFRFSTAIDITSIANLASKVLGTTLNEYRTSILSATTSAKQT